ncbi:MAG: ABC transporter permease subunit [Chloroflexi bacterium]|nr:ABC transporter permease subunit [Chloroflexota bacterium]
MSAQAPAPPSPSPGGPAPSESVSLFYRRGFRRLLQQGLYVAATGLLFWYIYDALNLREFGFGFLSDPAAFKVANQWLIDIDGVTNSRINMYLVGVWASLRVVFVAILLSIVVGIVVGVSRLSSNWLVARMAMLYVEVFRNTPLLVQVVLVYAIFLVGAPLIQNSQEIGDFAFISNRGVAIPWPVPDAGWWGAPDWFVGVWVALFIAIGAIAMTVRRRRQDRERETGQPQYANRWAFGIFAIGALVTFIVLGLPVSIDKPIIEVGTTTRYLEGMVIRPEFAALTIGLTLYTGAFNAEIVRGSIQALPRGQTEAANAVGLSAYQRMTLVILPQALRQMIPSITNQCLNVNKNSSLAYAVLYDDLFRVAGIIQNKAGHALEMFFVIIVTYMLISLVISAVMNFINARVTRVGV